MVMVARLSRLKCLPRWAKRVSSQPRLQSQSQSYSHSQDSSAPVGNNLNVSSAATATTTTTTTTSSTTPTPLLKSSPLLFSSSSSLPHSRSKVDKDRRRKQQQQQQQQPQPQPLPPKGGKVLVVSCNEVPTEQMLRYFPTARKLDANVVCFSDLSAQFKTVTFVFSYGICVFWGGNQSCQQSTLTILNRSGEPAAMPLPKACCSPSSWLDDDDMFLFSHETPTSGGRGGNRKVSRDGSHFTLFDQSLRLKLVLSHAFAQSVRLDVLEKKFAQVSLATRDIALKQRQSGKVPDDWEEADLISTVGALESFVREVNIDGYLRHTRDLFWDEDDLSETLVEIRDYLDVTARAEILTEQIGYVIQQLRRILQEKSTHHSTEEHHGAVRLEWYIILLIAYEAIVIKFFDLGTIIKNWLDSMKSNPLPPHNHPHPHHHNKEMGMEDSSSKG